MCGKHAKLMQLGLLSCETVDCRCIAEPVPPFLWLPVCVGVGRGCGRCGWVVWVHVCGCLCGCL